MHLIRPLPRLVLLSLAAVTVATGCASSRDRIPLHVLLAPPTQVGRVGGVQDVTPFDLDATIEPLERELSSRFERVSLSDATSTADLERDAQQLRADLICVPTFRPGAGLARGINAKIAATLPLYLLGGPVAFFIDDRDYFWSDPARLDLDFWITTGAVASFRDENRVVRPGEISASVERVDLDFLERAGTRWSQYIWTIIIPPSFVATDVEAFRSRITRETAEALVDAVATEFQDRSEFEYAAHLGPFRIESARAIATRRSAGVVHVGAEIQPANGSVRITQCVVEAIDDTSTTSLGAVGEVRVPHDASGPLFVDLELRTEAEWIRLVVFDESGHSRGFTYPVR